MYTERRYGYWTTIKWSRKGLYFGVITGFVAVALYEVACLKWLTVPWQPVALIGTALAFYLGFKNNASYDRLWEAQDLGRDLKRFQVFWCGTFGLCEQPACNRKSER